MAKQVKKDVEIGVAVTKTGNGAEKANRDLKKLEAGFKKTTREAARLTVKSAALDAKQKQLGKAVASGSMTVKKAAKEYQKFAEKLDKTTKASQGANAAQSKSKGILEVAKANWMALAGGVVAAGVAIKTAKEAFDFAAEGAAIQQLEESFDRLNRTVFKTPNLLEDMTEATRGTVSPMKLMKGVMTLTAGASDEMAQKFALASPKLAEIAKAAQKLNPTLGDTAFLYDSIATGIKRSSPLILDNLGIVVKIGQANEEYAAQLGKTVEELTAMEKQSALLNATIKAGNQLIKQVGGDVGSGMDKYARLSTAVDILKDGMKSLAADALGPVVGYFADLLTQAKEAKELQEIARTAQQVAADLYEIRFGAAAGEDAIKDVGLQFQEWFRLQAEGDPAYWDNYEKTVSQFAESFAKVAEENLGWTVDEHFNAAILETQKALSGVADGYGEVEIAAEKADQRERARAKRKGEEFRAGKDEEQRLWDFRRMAATDEREMDALKRQDRELINEKSAEAIELAQELADAEAEAAEEAQKVADEIAEIVAELEKAARVRFSTGVTSELKSIKTAAEAGEEVTTNLNNVMFESAVASGVTGIAYLELARSTGLYTDEQIRAAIRTQAMKAKAEDLGRQIADNNLTVGEAIQELEDFNAELDRVPNTVGIDFEFNLPPLPPEIQALISEELASPVQIGETPGGVTGHGGLSGIVPGGFPNDSFPIMVESGERVLVQTKAQQRAGTDLHGNQISGKTSGGTKIMHSRESNVFLVQDESMARFVAHQIDESRRQSYEEFMGRG